MEGQGQPRARFEVTNHTIAYSGVSKRFAVPKEVGYFTMTVIDDVWPESWGETY